MGKNGDDISLRRMALIITIVALCCATAICVALVAAGKADQAVTIGKEAFGGIATVAIFGMFLL